MKPKQKKQKTNKKTTKTPNRNKQKKPKTKPNQKRNQNQVPKQQKGDNLNFVAFTGLVQFFRSQDPRTAICKGHVLEEQNGIPVTKERADVRLRECCTSSR